MIHAETIKRDKVRDEIAEVLRSLALRNLIEPNIRVETDAEGNIIIYAKRVIMVDSFVIKFTREDKS